jgi:fatty-acyl-CoA synthase
MFRSMNVAWWVERWAELEPEKAALLYEDENISYSQLHARANRTACWLHEMGVGKGDRVAVVLNNCPEFMEIYLASARIGAIFVPINYRLAAVELDYILKNCKPRLLVYGDQYEETVMECNRLEQTPRLAWVGEGDPSEGRADFRTGTAAFDGRTPYLTSSLGVTDPEEPQVIMYTSGTTGHPKGAVLTHRKTFFNSLNADIFFNLSHHDVILTVLPLFHSGGLFIAASPCLYKGASLVIDPKFDPVNTYRQIERNGVTKFLGVPTVFRRLLEVDGKSRGDTSSLQICAIGGEHVTAELIAECNENGFPVRQIMGQTETSILLWASEEESLQKPGTIGRPVFHADVGLVDRSGLPVLPGDVGEIVVSGSIVMKEYWGDPVETQNTIRGGRLHTGDLARQDEEGYFYLVDRVKDMYISGGENVYPVEIERVIREHPGVAGVAVIGVPHDRWGEVGHAFINCKAGAVVTEDEILELCRRRLARYKWPKRVTFCEEFTKTALGKVCKFVLREQLDEA